MGVRIISMLLFVGAAASAAAQSNVDVASGAVDRAVSEFVSSLTPPERQQFQNARRKEDLSLFHFGSGSRFRAKYFVTPPVSAVRRYYCGEDANQYCDIDAASMDMVERAWKVIRAESQQ